jgi:uncharacterized RDD family membrane protein YckC
MSTDQPTPGSEEPPEDPFAKQPEGSGTDSPSGPPPQSEAPEDEVPVDPLAGMPPLAHRWKRLVARIIDSLIVGIPLGVILGLIFDGYDYTDAGRSFWQDFIYAVVYFGYDGYMLTTRGQTFGKRWMKIRVAMLDSGTNPEGQPGWTRAAVYGLPPIVPCCGSLFWLVNVLWCLWDEPYHHCLHDKAAKTVVVSVP